MRMLTLRCDPRLIAVRQRAPDLRLRGRRLRCLVNSGAIDA
jgi:hypothetical protein